MEPSIRIVAVLLVSPAAIVVPVFVLLLLVLATMLYTRKVADGLVAGRRELDKGNSEVVRLLKQYHDELPKLVSAARSYMPADAKVIRAIVEARSAYGRATSVADTALAAASEAEAARALFVEAETDYPELELNNSFRQVRRHLDEITRMIAKELDRVGTEVRHFNQRLGNPPDSLVASLNKIKPYPAIDASVVKRLKP